MSKLTLMTIGAALAAMTASLSCTALRPGLIGHDALRDGAVEMAVGGRSGWALKKSIVFGPFHTSLFNTGVATVNANNKTGSRFTMDPTTRYTTAHQGFTFTQYDSARDSVEVRCVAARTSKTTQYTDLLSDDSSSDRYEMHLSKSTGEKAVATYIKGKPAVVSFGKDTLAITDENKSDRKEKMAFQGMLFNKAGETVAAVSLISGGSVWIKKDLDDKCKLLIAAITSAMLVKPNLENASPR